MGFFDFLKPKKTVSSIGTGASNKESNHSYFETAINETDLRELINKAIAAFMYNPGADANRIIDAIKVHRDEEALALALYRFIPIAWCRLFVPEVAYSDKYVLFRSEKDQQSFSLSSDDIYKIVAQECKIRFEQRAPQDDDLAILFHSADFNAINNALKGGSKLEDLETAPSYFL